MYTIKGKYTEALLTIDNLEEECINQVYRMINHVAFDKPVAIMVDGHAGKGSCVGFTMPLSINVIPNVVGVDLGCGIASANLGNKLNITLKKLDDEIRARIPMGTNAHERPYKINSETFSFEKHFPWESLSKELLNFIRAYNEKFDTNYKFQSYDYRDFGALCNKINAKRNRVELSVNSLGSGNHFAEINVSQSGDYWANIHSGSRNFGKLICEFHQGQAKKILDNKRNKILNEKIQNIVSNTKDKSKIKSLIDEAKKDLGLDFDFDIKGLEFLEGGAAFEYLKDMVVAQKYAEFNRQQMLLTICDILGGIQPKETIETVHNYIDFRDFIIRKGAIRSYVGEKMVIPFNMRDGILVCEGKSNSDWNYSAPHGAGRKFSRSKSREIIDLNKFKKQMEGIHSTSVCRGTLDEAPDAYKDSKMIEEAIEPTAFIIDRLKPILSIKDKNSGPSWKERREAKKKAQQRKSERKAKSFQKMKRY